MLKKPPSSRYKYHARRNKIEPLSLSIGKLTKPVFGRRGMADGAIVKNWNEIVGAAIAQHSHPEKISYPSRDRTNGLLHLRVDGSSMATQLQHLTPQLIERINAHFGFAAVKRLRFIHGPFPKKIDGISHRSRPNMSEKRREELDQLLSPVNDPQIKSALERLGRVITEN